MLAGKPDAGNPHVRFDEGEQREWRKPPVALYSTTYPAELYFVCPCSFYQIESLPPFRLIEALVFGNLGLGTSFGILCPAFGKVELEIDQCELILLSEAGKHSDLAIFNLACTT